MDVMEWLQEVRKLDADLLAAMGVRAVDHKALGRAVAFPYRRDGKTYAAKFRTVEKKFMSTERVSRGLYNADDLGRLQSLPVVITEGEIDCLSVMQAGFERAVSVPDGWTAAGNKTAALVDAEAGLRNSPYVIVAGDADESGESLPRAVANLLRGHDVRAARWPDGCKDANDVLVKHGAAALVSCLNAAVRLDPPGGFITGISDLPPVSARRVLRTGHYLFDRAVALEVGALSVWTGIPGSGKSTFLLWAANVIASHEKIRVGLMPFETHTHRVRDQLARNVMDKPFAEIEGENRRRLLEFLDQRFKVVHRTFGDKDAHHLKWLEETCYALAVRDQCKLIVIDPWNELEHLPEPGESLTNYINFATQRIRQIAEKLEVHIALVAHPKKMNGDGKPRHPNGYDVADSAAFFNKPSLGVTVHQNAKIDDATGEEDRWVELHVWKVRDVELYGFRPGKVVCDFDQEAMRYNGRHHK